MWVNHFKGMVNGQIPHLKSVYLISPSVEKSQNDLQLISPSEAVVQRARSDLKRSLQDLSLYKSKKSRSSVQLGEGKQRRNTTSTKKKRPAKKKKKVVSSSKTKTNSKSKKKKSTKKKIIKKKRKKTKKRILKTTSVKRSTKRKK